MRDPPALLRGIVDRQIPVSQVVASRSVSSDQEAADIIKLLSKTAVEMNLVSVVDELSRTQALGNSLLPDPLQDIPEARPVLRPKVLTISLWRLLLLKDDTLGIRPHLRQAFRSHGPKPTGGSVQPWSPP